MKDSGFDTTVTGLVEIFRDALIALVPVMERAHLPWREPDAYDQWDSIATTLHRYLLVEPIQWALADEGLTIAPYDVLTKHYSNVGRIEVVDSSIGRPLRNAFLKFVTDQKPFDTAKVVILDPDARRPLRKGFLRIPHAGAIYELVIPGGTGEATRIRDLNVPN